MKYAHPYCWLVKITSVGYNGRRAVIGKSQAKPAYRHRAQHTRVGTSKQNCYGKMLVETRRGGLAREKAQNSKIPWEKSLQHPVFPGGHPSKY